MDSKDDGNPDSLSEFERLFGVQEEPPAVAPSQPVAPTPPPAAVLPTAADPFGLRPSSSPEFLGADALAASPAGSLAPSPPPVPPLLPTPQSPPPAPLFPDVVNVPPAPVPAPAPMPAFGGAEPLPIRREGAHTATAGSHTATGPIDVPAAVEPAAAAPAWMTAPAPALAPEAIAPAVVLPPAPPVTAPPITPAAAAPFDFSDLLTTPNAADEAPQQPGALLLGLAPRVEEDPTIDRSTIPERILLVLAFLLPPVGLIGGIVGAVRSTRRRGWVIGVVKATIVIGAVLSIVAGVGGYLGKQYLNQQAQHAQIVADSAPFCAVLAKDPTMLKAPDFGWPAAAPSIPDSITAMQAYVTKWDALAKVSPAGIQPGVKKVADAARQIVGAVTVSRTVDDAQNIQVMTSAASQSGVPAWHSQYCS